MNLLTQKYTVLEKYPNKIFFICEVCGKELSNFKSQIKTGPNNHHYCCKEHRNIGYKEQCKGSKNSNFHKKWSQSLREKQSLIMKQHYIDDPTLAYRCGSTNRGKTKDTCSHLKQLSETRKRLIASGKISLDSLRHPISPERKIQIGIEHKAFMNDPKTKKHYRDLNEASGRWKPLSEKPSMEIYYKEANWIESMFNRANLEEQKLLKEYGVFNYKTNSKGCVRDHIYSRRSGFQNGVFPELLRHPCNCQIITHFDNISKAHKKINERYTDNDYHTLQELFAKIQNYSGEWKEQQLCLKLIKDYNSGLRWVDPYKENNK
jgi:hypothetical protein